jgi:hypothetical protein
VHGHNFDECCWCGIPTEWFNVGQRFNENFYGPTPYSRTPSYLGTRSTTQPSAVGAEGRPLQHDRPPGPSSRRLRGAKFATTPDCIDHE